MATRRLLPLALAVTLFAAPVPSQASSLPLTAPARTAVSVEHAPSGVRAGTPNEHGSRPALSLIKLYLADHVVAYGSPEEAADALHMVRTSDDATASRLHARCPNAIADTAAAHGLHNTHAAAHWGNSTTSTADVTRYLANTQRTAPHSPVLQAMREATPVAADGYVQNFGTATLPGVQGTKFGWSDDRTSMHASASLGHGLTVSAHTYGTAEDHSADVRAALGQTLMP